jgi:hypothetical protein
VTRTFVCDSCGETVATERPDEEAREEARSVFPQEELEGPVAVVCGDCLKKLREADPVLDQMYRDAGL